MIADWTNEGFPASFCVWDTAAPPVSRGLRAESANFATRSGPNESSAIAPAHPSGDDALAPQNSIFWPASHFPSFYTTSRQLLRLENASSVAYTTL